MSQSWNPLGVHLTIARLYLAQRGECFHCNKPMLWRQAFNKNGSSRDTGWTREHIKPYCFGGRNYRNLVLAHKRCNMDRGTDKISDELMVKFYRILDKSEQLTQGQLAHFLSNKTLWGTYCQVFEWPTFQKLSEEST